MPNPNLQLWAGMKRLLLLILLFTLPARAAELWLKVGEVRTLPAGEEAVVRIGSRGVIRAVDSAAGIQVIGLKPGATSLVIGARSYLVRVGLAAQNEFTRELRLLLKRMMGLNLQTDTKQISITGTLIRFSDWQKIAELARHYDGEYVFKAKPLPDVAETAMDHFRELAKAQSIPVTRFAAGSEIKVQIPKGAPALRTAAERAYKPFGISVDVSAADLSIAPLVRTRVILAEVSKSFSQDLGVQWPSEYKAQLIPRFKGDEGLMVTLRALEARGQAQILASPTLLCRSGSHAQFHAGGEFPVRIISRASRDVLWKPHGVILHVKPVADFNGAMSIEVETEVSLLDMAHAVDGIPALKKNRVQSHFDLPGKRTIALSGLLRQELGESQEGLPFLSGIPVLGALFSSQKFLNHQTELVVFVTPEIYTPDSDEPLAMPEGWVRQ